VLDKKPIQNHCLENNQSFKEVSKQRTSASSKLSCDVEPVVISDKLMEPGRLCNFYFCKQVQRGTEKMLSIKRDGANAEKCGRVRRGGWRLCK
jgi:hypothetical protein